jgi:hypothetical protein
LEDLQRQLDEALSEAAAEKIRADQAEEKFAAEKVRADGISGRLDAEKSQHEALQKERLDVDVEKLQKENKNLRIMLDNEKRKRLDAEDPDRIRNHVRERVDLERAAAPIMGDKFRMDELTDRQIREAVIQRLDAPVEETRTDAYVVGKFDALVKGNVEAREVMQQVTDRVLDRAEKERVRADSTQSARQKFLDERENAWKTTHKSA